MSDIYRVLHFGMTNCIGGVETYLFQQYQHLDNERINYDFIDMTENNNMAYKDEIISKGSRVFSIEPRRRNPIKHYIQIMMLLFKYRKYYDAVVLNAASLEYVFPVFVAKLVGIKTRIIHAHNAGYSHKITFLRRILILFNTFLTNNSVTKFFSCSKKAASWMFGDRENVTIVHNAVDAKRFRFNQKKRKRIREYLGIDNLILIGHIGRFCYQKNQEYLVEVLIEILKKNNEVKLCFIGEDGEFGYQQKIKNMIHNKGLDDKVVFLGKRKYINDIMQALDVLALPSNYEGFPVVGVEAQAAGLPLLCSDKITNELQFTRYVKFLSIEGNTKKWADTILEASSISHADNFSVLQEKNYDVSIMHEYVNQLYEMEKKC